MREMYKDMFKKKLLSADDLRDIVVYLPLMGLSPLDWEYITGLTWEVDEV